MPTTTAFVSSARFVEHDTGASHPERPDRIRAIHRAVRLAGLVESADPFPEFEIAFGPSLAKARLPLYELDAVPAAESSVHLVHTAQMIDRIRSCCAHGAVLDQSDTPTCPSSYEIAMLSVGSALRAVDFVMDQPDRRGFSCARPPGHHAEVNAPMGFCLFNNIAIAARYARKQYDLERIAIVDFDVHHGNGTQDVFEDDPTTLFISMHEDPKVLYPGSGHDYEVGGGAGRGYTVNLPMSPNSGDEEYARVMAERVVPTLDQFKPQLLLISAGFDAHAEDPLAHVQLTDDGFEQITRTLVAVADAHCEGKIVSVLEGGYNLRALGRSVVRHLIALSDS